jgi:hypothetical protein
MRQRGVDERDVREIIRICVTLSWSCGRKKAGYPTVPGLTTITFS